jgi:hypothetical protein
LWTEIRSALAQASENVRHGRSPFELTMKPSRGAASEALPSFASSSSATRFARRE